MMSATDISFQTRSKTTNNMFDHYLATLAKLKVKKKNKVKRFELRDIETEVRAEK